MTKKMVMALVLGLTAASARADVSDSGNLTIGGQAVIAGSMTVTGPIAGSSVTLSTTGATVYALTTSTGIHVLNGRVKLESGSYIEWPDGTKSTTSTAGGGGTGNVLLTATQTFSGGNSLYGSTTFYGFVSLSSGSGVGISSAIFLGRVSITNTAWGVGAATITFTSPFTAACYHVMAVYCVSSGAGVVTEASLLLNGAFPSEFSTTKITRAATPGAGGTMCQAPLMYTWTNPPAGVNHTIALAFRLVSATTNTVWEPSSGEPASYMIVRSCQ